LKQATRDAQLKKFSLQFKDTKKKKQPGDDDETPQNADTLDEKNKI